MAPGERNDPTLMPPGAGNAFIEDKVTMPSGVGNVDINYGLLPPGAGSVHIEDHDATMTRSGVRTIGPQDQDLTPRKRRSMMERLQQEAKGGQISNGASH